MCLEEYYWHEKSIAHYNTEVFILNKSTLNVYNKYNLNKPIVMSAIYA